MVPDKFNMVDMEGIDIIANQGEEFPGLYQKLVESVAQCRYQCLYNWKSDGVNIPPTFVELVIDSSENILINESVYVTPEDVIMINFSITIGEISRYYKQTVRFTENTSYISITNPFGEDFKFMQIKPVTAPVENGAIITAASNAEIGGQISRNWTTGDNNYTFLTRKVSAGMVPSNNEFILTNELIVIGRPGGSYFWEADTDYVIELYF